MQVSKDRVVSIHYTLTDNAGEVLDSSSGGAPLNYIQGNNMIIPGLEQALEGEETGASRKVTITPEDGYGQRDDGLIQEIPRANFSGVDDLQEGMQFQAQTEEGSQIVQVVEVAEDTVKVDANHPLAGETLNFAVEVVEVRDASSDELEHGHVHEG